MQRSWGRREPGTFKEAKGRCGWSESWYLYEMGLESGQGQTHGVCGQVNELRLDREVL